jgi:hypothetical protein
MSYQHIHVLRCGCLLAGIMGSNPRRCMNVLSPVSVVCCQVQISATSWSLVQRSPTECDVSECDRESFDSLIDYIHRLGCREVTAWRRRVLCACAPYRAALHSLQLMSLLTLLHLNSFLLPFIHVRCPGVCSFSGFFCVTWERHLHIAWGEIALFECALVG